MARINTKIKDPKILNKAYEVLVDYEQGRILARVANNGRYKMLDVGQHYRIIIDKASGKCELLTHQAYNKRLDRF